MNMLMERGGNNEVLMRLTRSPIIVTSKEEKEIKFFIPSILPWY